MLALMEAELALLNLTGDGRRMTDPSVDMVHHAAWRYSILFLYVVIILCGFVFNAFIVYVVIAKKGMRNVTNILIMTLALSDIGMCVFNVPFQLHYQLSTSWAFGESLCRIIMPTFAVPLYVSTFTILLIAFDRYWLIVRPLKKRLDSRRACGLIVVSVVVSFVLAVPVMMFTKLKVVDEPLLGLTFESCMESWPPGTSMRLPYSVTLFVIQFCIPLTLACVLYTHIYRHLKARRIRQSGRKKRTNRILVAIVTLFIVCWLPWQLFVLIQEIDWEIVRGKYFRCVDLLLKAFAMSSASINPFLYGWLNENFRKEFNVILHRIQSVVSRSPSSQNETSYQLQGITEPQSPTIGITSTADNTPSSEHTRFFPTVSQTGAVDHSTQGNGNNNERVDSSSRNNDNNNARNNDSETMPNTQL